MPFRVNRRWGVVLALLLSACTAAPLATLSVDRTEAAWQGSGEVARRPLIVVPGFQGSTLFDEATGQRVWDSFVGNYARPNDPAGMRLLALPMEHGVPLRHLRDEVKPDGLMRRFAFKLLRLIPLQVQGYGGLIENLEAEGYRFEPPDVASDALQDYDAFIFTYDWRHDNVENAQRLFRFIREKRALLQQQALRRGEAAQDIRFDLVSHSMGGLVVRYMLRYGDTALPTEGVLPAVTWAGAQYVAEVVMTAPPNAGSLRPFRALVEGRKYLPGMARFQPAVLGTLPALYQLLPREGGGRVIFSEDTTHATVDLFDADLWERMGWGLADPTQAGVLRILLPDVPTAAARRRIALDHLRKSLDHARRFAAVLDAPAVPPPSLTLHLIAGDAEPTDAVAAWNRETRRLHTTRRQKGDSRVLSSSARLPWPAGFAMPHGTTFMEGRHMGLTRNPVLARFLYSRGR